MERASNKNFLDAVVGLSDHSVDNLASLVVAAGASVLERHFTDSKSRPGPDICCSMDAKECSELIKQLARMAEMRGGIKGELTKKGHNRFCICECSFNKTNQTWRSLIKGKKTGSNVLNSEFLAEDSEQLLGKVATSDIPENIQLEKVPIYIKMKKRFYF